MLPVTLDNADPLADAFRTFLSGSDFPCMGAKAALAKGQLRFIVARAIDSAWDDLRIYAALFNFAHAYHSKPGLFQSFVVLFREPQTLEEPAYEDLMWERLQSMTDKDGWHGQVHDRRVSADPDDPHFSVSFAGEAFFVVGLHPKASRPARRFQCPAMVFNPHDQFEQLRAQNIFDGMRQKIARRDEKLAGSGNPMLQPYGEGSEARQYSGRAVDTSWRCPFRRR